MSDDDMKGFGCGLFVLAFLLISLLAGLNFAELNSKAGVGTLTCSIHEVEGKRTVWYGRAHYWTVPTLGKLLFKETIKVPVETKLKDLQVIEDSFEQVCIQKQEEFGSSSKVSASVSRN